MFMTIRIGRGEVMVDVLRNGEGREGHEQENQADRQTSSQPFYDVPRQHGGGRSITITRSLSNQRLGISLFHLVDQ